MLHLNNENFDSEIKEGLVILDFWAEWCGPCKMLGPIFESLSKEMTEYKFCKVNVDDNSEVSAKFSVRGIPTMVFLKDGKELDRIVGSLPQESLKAKIKAIFS